MDSSYLSLNWWVSKRRISVPGLNHQNSIIPVVAQVEHQRELDRQVGEPLGADVGQNVTLLGTDILVGGFKYCLFSPLFGEDFHFD